MQSSLIQLFYLVSQSMLTPVMLMLFAAMMLLVLVAGNTSRLAIERYTIGRTWFRFMESVRKGASGSDWQKSARVGLPKWLSARCGSTDDIQAIEMRLPEAELLASRYLARLQVLIRIGPMLGLVGTLLPLGPALQDLSSSQLSLLGENLNVAFTTTVFGIIVGAFAYALHSVHRSWFERDLNDIECVLATLKRKDVSDAR